MREESIINKAIGLMPGVGRPKRAKNPAAAQTQLAALQRNLAKLSKDVEKLTRLLTSGKEKGTKRAAGKRTSGKSRARQATATAARRSR